MLKSAFRNMVWNVFGSVYIFGTLRNQGIYQFDKSLADDTIACFSKLNCLSIYRIKYCIGPP